MDTQPEERRSNWGKRLSLSLRRDSPEAMDLPNLGLDEDDDNAGQTHNDTDTTDHDDASSSSPARDPADTGTPPSSSSSTSSSSASSTDTDADAPPAHSEQRATDQPYMVEDLPQDPPTTAIRLGPSSSVSPSVASAPPPPPPTPGKLVRSSSDPESSRSSSTAAAVGDRLHKLPLHASSGPSMAPLPSPVRRSVTTGQMSLKPRTSRRHSAPMSTYSHSAGTLYPLFENMDEPRAVPQQPFSIFNVIQHDSELRIYWDLFMVALLLYTVIIIPLELAFTPLSNGLSLGLDIIVTLGFAMNIAITFRTAIERTETIITDPEEIARVYLQKWFWVDLAATIPWDLFLQAIFTTRSGSILQVSRLLRLMRLLRLWSGETFDMAYSTIFMRLLKLIVYSVCMAHTLGCIWFFVSDTEDFDGNGIIADSDLASASGAYQYIISFHWGLRGLISMGSELGPKTTLQAFLCIVVITSGVILFATIIGNIELLLEQSAASSIRFHEHVNRLQDFFDHHDIPEELRRHLMQHTHHYYRTQRGMDDQTLLSSLPVETRNRVFRFMYKKELQKCDLFEKCDDGFLDALCTVVRPQVALAGDIIIRQGSIGQEMYIIHKGEAEAVDLLTGDVHNQIREGRFFGEIALFTDRKRTISVRAVTYMELYTIPKDSFFELLQFYPREESLFIQVARQRVATTHSIASALTRDDMKPGGGTRMWDEKDVERFYKQNHLEALASAFDFKDVASFIERFDTNHDGQLDESERKYVVKYLKARAERLREIQELDEDTQSTATTGNHDAASALSRSSTTSDFSAAVPSPGPPTHRYSSMSRLRRASTGLSPRRVGSLHSPASAIHQRARQQLEHEALLASQAAKSLEELDSATSVTEDLDAMSSLRWSGDSDNGVFEASDLMNGQTLSLDAPLTKRDAQVLLRELVSLRRQLSGTSTDSANTTHGGPVHNNNLIPASNNTPSSASTTTSTPNTTTTTPSNHTDGTPSSARGVRFAAGASARAVQRSPSGKRAFTPLPPLLGRSASSRKASGSSGSFVPRRGQKKRHTAPPRSTLYVLPEQE